MPKKEKLTPTNFIATVYGDITPLNNSSLSKARLKIFYKGLNRNGSYITDEVAEELIATLPGVPVVGYYDSDKDDFLNHVEKEKSRCYGFVPQEMNFNWEMNLDPDGVYRTYACTDVILWTGRYPIASKIVGKSHSMELNPDTAEGEWVDTEDTCYYKFTKAEFIGLCVLGNDYEPCFEGSSFYELREKNQNVYSDIKNDLKELFSLYEKVENAENNSIGGEEMDKNEEVKNPETPVTDSEVIETENNKEEEVVENGAENKEEQEVVVENENKEEVVENNNENEEEVVENETEVPTENALEDNAEEENAENNDEEERQEVNEEEDIEKEFSKKLQEKDEEIAQLKAELNSLKEYKHEKVLEEKNSIIENYAARLSAEEVQKFKEEIESYESVLDLKKDIALCLLDKTQELQSDYSLVKAGDLENYTGAAAIVAKYKKKNK